MREDNTLFEMLQSGKFDALGEALLEENQRLADDLGFSPLSKSQEEILSKAYQEIELREKQRCQSARVRRLTTLRRVAIIVIAALVALTITAMSVEAIRVPIFRFFTEQQQRSTRVSKHSDEGLLSPSVDPGSLDSYFLRWIPEGFVKESEDNTEDYYQITYTNADSATLRFTAHYYRDYWFDTENADVIEPLIINGMDGSYVEKGGKSLVMWADETNLIVFDISGNLPKAALIQIAEASGLKN